MRNRILPLTLVGGAFFAPGNEISGGKNEDSRVSHAAGFDVRVLIRLRFGRDPGADSHSYTPTSTTAYKHRSPD
jgi:hypothetical protein